MLVTDAQGAGNFELEYPLLEESRPMRQKIALLVAGLMFAAAVPQVLAHHSFAAEFDASKPFKFQGTVTKVLWTNPHSFFHLDVVDEKTRQVTDWAMEMGGPNALLRMGWKRDTLKAGDKVEVEGSRAKDGSPTGNARSITLLATGQRLFAGSSQGDANQ